jgi:isopenicillin N synthase-like dioxygenase
VINHGVPQDLKEAMVEACKELFNLPDEEKAEHFEAEPMAPIRIGSGFNAVVDGARYWRNYLKMFAHPELHCPEKPAKLRHSTVHDVLLRHHRSVGIYGAIAICRALNRVVVVREVAAEYSTKTRHLLLLLAKAISESLGLHAGRFSEALNLDSCFQILVGNHYPPYTGSGDMGMGLPAHSDHGLLTLLFQDGVDGLQVKHDEQWLLTKPLPGAFFVIAGDQLEVIIIGRSTTMPMVSLVHARGSEHEMYVGVQIVSNGRYKAVIHRAVVGGEQERMSFVSMISPSMDTVVEPVPELAQEGQGLVFQGVRYRDYMAHQQSNKLEVKEALNIARAQRGATTDNVEHFN